MILAFEDEAGLIIDDHDSPVHHHEDTESFEKKFKTHVRDIVKVIEEDGNLFEGGNNLISLVTNNVMTDEAAKSVMIAEQVGNDQYKQYLTERLIEGRLSIHNVIKRNNLKLFKKQNSLSTNKDRNKFKALKEDCSLFSRLYIACQEFFSHENHSYPPSIAEYGLLRKCAKSDIVTCLEKVVPPVYEKPSISGVILDGAAIVHMIKPGVAKCFKQYSQDCFFPYIKNHFKSAARVDLVFDTYQKLSLKSETRARRGSGNRLKVRPETPIPRDWSQFLQVDENKAELFRLLCEYAPESDIADDKTLVCTRDEKLWSTSSDIKNSDLSPCTHEEADTRILLHAKHAGETGHNTLLIVTVDSDVVVLALYSFQFINVQELWISFGVGKSKRYIAIHQLAASLGPDTCLALPYWHAFTGCDTTSSFCGIGKKTAWEVWRNFPDVTELFKALSSVPKQLTQEHIDLLQRYVVLLYDRSSSLFSVNKCRMILFCQKNKLPEGIPPTKDALIQHSRRAAFQAGHIWGQCLNNCPNIPDPTTWGWTKSHSGFIPLWTTIPSASDHCRELIHCRCKKECTKRCKCRKEEVMCTALCGCNEHCSNHYNQ